MYNVQCTMNTLYTIQCTLYTLYTIQCTMNTLYTIQCTMNILYTIRCTISDSTSSAIMRERRVLSYSNERHLDDRWAIIIIIIIIIALDTRPHDGVSPHISPHILPNDCLYFIVYSFEIDNRIHKYKCISM